VQVTADPLQHPHPRANVRLGFGRLNIPDVIVLSEPKDVVFNQAADVPLVAEVVSDTGKARDRILSRRCTPRPGFPGTCWSSAHRGWS
jgi:hypothetical protein